MSTAQIRFATDVLRRLGEELNPSPDKGILELAKNAYDADALTCTVELIDTDQVGGTVRVIDGGDGMDIDEIKKGWLVIGRSEKSAKQRTRLNRIPAGSKGLGRLAALRLGSVAELTTRPRKQENVEYHLRIDWRDYEGIELVDDVVLTIETRQRAEGKSQGTEIELRDLGIRIGRMEVKRIARELILLANPWHDDPEGFKPDLKAPEFSDLETLVRKRYFDDAEYHLIARVDDHGLANATVVDWKGKELFAAKHDELTLSRNREPYRCPPIEFDLWVFILNSLSFSTRKSTLAEVRKWLQEFGGVHLYQNGLRVMPYGNPGNDWLDINLRRAQSPEERPSTNTVIGRVMIMDTEELLIQKTDRSGFIEGEAFLGMRHFAQDAMEWMAARRLEIAEQRREKERTAAPKKMRKWKKTLDDTIAKAPKDLQAGLKKALETYDHFREKEVDKLQKEIQLYRTLSTAGITASTFAHESSASPIKVIGQSIKAIERRAKEQFSDIYEKLFKKPIEGILRAVDSLNVLGAATLKLLDHEKRRTSRVDLHDVINAVINTFKPFLEGRDVTVEPQFCKGAPYLRGSEAAIESIVTNLLNNSLAAFERTNTTNRRILICTEVEENVFTLRVLDNGPGIEGISKKDIWLPGYTTQKNGTGLGLTIVRDSVKDLGGEADAIEHGKLGGAEIIIELPILGV